MNTKELIDEAVSLPVEERVILADFLLRSLHPPESAIDQQWASVAQRRLCELRSACVPPTPGDEVFARVWKQFRI